MLWWKGSFLYFESEKKESLMIGDGRLVLVWSRVFFGLCGRGLGIWGLWVFLDFFKIRFKKWFIEFKMRKENFKVSI